MRRKQTNNKSQNPMKEKLRANLDTSDLLIENAPKSSDFLHPTMTRHIPSLITDGGFTIDQLNEEYLASYPKFGTYCFWGAARLGS